VFVAPDLSCEQTGIQIMNEEALRSQLERLAIHRENLAVLLDQQARTGGKAHASLAVIGGIREQRDYIRRIKHTLRTAGEVVEDMPDDSEEQVPLPPHNQIKPSTAQTSPAQQDQVDVLIIAPLREEREAVLAKLPGAKRLPRAQHVFIYYEAQVPVSGQPSSQPGRRVIVTSPNDMGRVEAANVVGEAVERWKPRFVLLVGIAGGALSPEQRMAAENADGLVGGVAAKGVGLGDVLVAREIVDYELQKLTLEQIQIRWKVNPVDQQLLAAAQHLERHEWAPLIAEQRPVAGSPRLHFGPVASGDKVVAYSEGLKQVQDVWSKLIGVEMEAGGVAQRVAQTVTRPGFFMVRGVSDLADERKGKADVDAWRAYACDVAAAYAVGLIQSDIFP
jgi:nucleoside phosphorylase